MLSIHQPNPIRIATALAATALVAAFGIPHIALGQSQNQFSEPVYRVANETPAQAVATLPTSPAQSTLATTLQAPFDLTQQPGEHPLAPVIRVCKASLAHIEQDVHDYSCTLVKHERIEGELGENQHIFLKARHDPFSVYMQFLQPYQGREVLFVDGQHDNEMLVLEAGWKRKMLGKMQLDPEGMVAMRGQKHPITQVGLKNLLTELITRIEADCQFAECEVTSAADKAVNGRSATMIQILHPVPRQNFRAHIARIFFDNELKVPIHYDSFLWPEQPGGHPPLEESYTYTNLKLNNGFTSRDFDADNPEIFKL